MTEKQSNWNAFAGFHVTPLAVEMLIWFHGRAEPFDRLEAPACASMLKWMLDHALVEPHDFGRGGTYSTTARGDAWIAMFCNTPLPEQHWIDPRKP